MIVLKIILLAVLSIFALLIVACFLPATVFFSYDKKVLLKVYYCGIKVYSTTPSKNKPIKSEDEKQEPPKAKKTNFFKKVYDKLGFVGSIRYFAGLIKLLLKKLGWILKKIKVRKLKVKISVAASDAAQTAILYGEVCSVVYPVLSMLMSVIDCKVKKFDVSADFVHESPAVSASFNVRALPIQLIIAVLTGLWEYKKYKGVNFDE